MSYLLPTSQEVLGSHVADLLCCYPTRLPFSSVGLLSTPGHLDTWIGSERSPCQVRLQGPLHFIARWFRYCHLSHRCPVLRMESCESPLLLSELSCAFHVDWLPTCHCGHGMDHQNDGRSLYELLGPLLKVHGHPLAVHLAMLA